MLLFYFGHARCWTRLLLVLSVLAFYVDASSSIVNSTRHPSDSISKISKCLKGRGNKTESVHTTPTVSSQNTTNGRRKQGDGKPFKVLTSGEIHRQRIIVSGYLIFGVVCAGLAFLGVTHYLGRREVRKYQKKFGLTYMPAPRMGVHQV